MRRVLEISRVSRVNLAQRNPPSAFVQHVACVEAGASKRKDGLVNKFGPNDCSKPEPSKQLVNNNCLQFYTRILYMNTTLNWSQTMPICSAYEERIVGAEEY